ncbi:hypothetical protein JD844_013635 [Phrynosoma platyrhinos]|uniref:Alpha-macroglobulin receptor-binding domain-containing protein n=1 Tax=Phrynosoma platyrhinos TaxID=52577 RepID=A0ABQ7TM70_PHRPL|nr:hypothetical protein JD844_013635 [Phrynosoma platyrhinos]
MLPTEPFFPFILGKVPTDILQSSLTPEGLSSLLRVPHGCGEQTMIFLAPGVYAMHYLDQTEQWLHLKPESKEKALENLRTGVYQVPLYMRRRYTAAATSESSPSGGVGGLHGGVSLTAFITIALKQALAIYEGNTEPDPDQQRQKMEQLSQVKTSLAKATSFLAKSLNDQSLGPYPIAITSYALALASDDQSAIAAADVYLKGLASEDQSLLNYLGISLAICASLDKTVMFWAVEEKDRLQGERTETSHRVPPASAITVEATGYALLYLVKQNDVARASKVARWLTEQRNYGGGFRSTQLRDVPDRYISHWELQGRRLLLYIDSVPESERECLAFKAKQTVPVGKLQPASASIYDFYEPGKK